MKEVRHSVSGSPPVGVIDTLSTTTGDKRIAQISSATEADRSVVAAPIRSGFTLRIRSARIRVTQIIYKSNVHKDPIIIIYLKINYTLVEGSAAVEWMPSKALGTGADGFVLLDAAFSPNSASARARIDALKVEASLVVPTLFVCRTLRVTAAERISEEVGWAAADWTVILKSKFIFKKSIGLHLFLRIYLTYANVTFGIGTAGYARILATKSSTSTVITTI